MDAPTGRWTRLAGQLSAARLHVVSGKGGTGKTTAAAALALALATGGRRTLLVEVEGRQGIAQVFDTAPLPYEERRIAVAPGGGEVRALAVDPEAALLEYLEMFYRLGVAGRTLRRMGAIEFATTLAPGLRDVLLTGKAKECVARKGRDGRPVYDAVVLDAPPTGRVVSFLDVTRAMSDLARTGPIHSQSEGVVALVHSPRTAVHLVTLLEDLPVTETLETVAELEAADLRPGAVIVNRVRPQWLPDRSVAPAADGRVDAGADPHRPGHGRRGPRARGAGGAGRRDRRARRAGGGGGRGDEPAARGPRARCSSCRTSSTAWTSARSTSWPTRWWRRVSARCDGAAARVRTPPLDVDALLDDPSIRIVVCCGSGGVGKTTTSAALAVRAADRGRTVAVLTIDPARRLAQALGLTELGNEPGRVAGVPTRAATGRRATERAPRRASCTR